MKLLVALLLLLPVGAFFLNETIPYDFFTVLRFVVCAYFVWMAFDAVKKHYNQLIIFKLIKLKPQEFQFICFGIAILFNPLIPIHLDKEIWLFIDALLAAFLIEHHIVEKNSIDRAS